MSIRQLILWTFWATHTHTRYSSYSHTCSTSTRLRSPISLHNCVGVLFVLLIAFASKEWRKCLRTFRTLAIWRNTEISKRFVLDPEHDGKCTRRLSLTRLALYGKTTGDNIKYVTYGDWNENRINTRITNTRLACNNRWWRRRRWWWWWC